MVTINSRVLGYTTLRLALGIAMLLHGLNHFGDVQGFADNTANKFAHTLLPRPAVLGFAYSTPPVETVIGLLVLPGLFTRVGLVLGGLWMAALIFGSTLIERNELVNTQLLYSFGFFALLYCHEADALSLDGLLRSRLRGPGDAGTAELTLKTKAASVGEAPPDAP